MIDETDVSDPDWWHDPELPFLETLEEEVRRRAQRAHMSHERRQRLNFAGTQVRSGSIARPHATLSGRESLPHLARAAVDSADPSSTRQRGSLRMPMRMVRRSLTLMALMCLIGASAYGASMVFSSRAPNPLAAGRGAFALVASGGSGAGTWRLRLYMRGDELCRVLTVAETETSDCAAMPSAREIAVTSAQSPSSRYVFGVAGSKVMRVRVRLGHTAQTLTTRTPASGSSRLAGLPLGLRFYLGSFARSSRESGQVARVVGLSASGHPLGQPTPSCLETGEPGQC